MIMESPFASGPYTTNPPEPPPATRTQTPRPALSVPVCAHPLSRRDKITLLVIAGVLFALGCFVGNVGNEPAPERKTLPVCELEDGSTQKVCMYRSDAGELINLRNGEYMYDIRNNTLTHY